MINMSYCRFENTYLAMLECLRCENDVEKLSPREAKFRTKMFDLMHEFASELEEDNDCYDDD